MTVHSAKGLEFPVVFLVGMQDGLFPHDRSISEPDQLEEERRLFYVAITRSMDRLHLSWDDTRMMGRYPSPQVPSRFLREIPERLVKHMGGPDSSRPGRWEGRGSLRVGSPSPGVQGRSFRRIVSQSGFEVGDRVRHSAHGRGQGADHLRPGGPGVGHHLLPGSRGSAGPHALGGREDGRIRTGSGRSRMTTRLAGTPKPHNAPLLTTDLLWWRIFSPVPRLPVDSLVWVYDSYGVVLGVEL